jgi:hypothetical protein
VTTLVLQRRKRAGAWTDGDLFFGTEALCVTLEEPDRQNKKGISCIPAGLYRLFIRKNADTRHNYDVLELIGVPGRSNVQIHIGNRLTDTEGCILVGDERGQPGEISHSRVAYAKLFERVQELMEMMPGDVWLDVRDPA